MYIGVFDSGIGGLTVLKAFLKNVPNYTYKYFGDNVNAPYGEKTAEEIYGLTIKGIEFLFTKNCSLVILACNTASTVLPRIQQEWLPKYYPGRKVLGIIRPTTEHMLEKGQECVTLMATPATILAKSYEKELTKLGSDIKINPIACPGLAKAIEDSGGKFSSNVDVTLNNCLKDCKGCAPIYLGCTHYEYLEDKIAELTGCATVSQSAICSEKLKQYLQRHTEMVLKANSSYKLFFSTKPALSADELSKK